MIMKKLSKILELFEKVCLAKKMKTSIEIFYPIKLQKGL